ncbi:MAG: hypothetical protein C0596_19160 [Marinilabiliales bacterium]|nr:MAG: hypothetical protein C0596_19160 [Marinilabiliales bacterium]
MTKRIQKQLFILQGKSNSGKTVTLGKLHEEFVTSKIKVIADSFTKIGEDFCTIMEFEGIRIGITSNGKSKETLQSILEHFVNEGCIIIICEIRLIEYTKMNGKKSCFDCDIDYLESFKQTIVEKNPSKQKQSCYKINLDDDEQLLFFLIKKILMI